MIYKILHVVQIVFIVLAVFFLLIALNTIPLQPDGSEGSQENYQMLLSLCLSSVFWGVSFILFAVLVFFMKRRFNVSYDYLFVSGELRIAKVFNQSKRKRVCILDSVSILQVGDMESASYDRFRATPGMKEVICTPNLTASEGKFFMYVLAQHDGLKKLYVLECREELLVNMMQFLRRDILDRDYIPQARKAAQSV